MINSRKLPAGIQDFEYLRTSGHLYVDKTAYIHRLATMGKPYFLARPRGRKNQRFLGTPTFLVKMLKDLNFDLTLLEKDVNIPARSIFDYRVGDSDPVPLLYQTGYLTIKNYIERSRSYTLGFPNEEVKYSLCLRI